MSTTLSKTQRSSRTTSFGRVIATSIYVVTAVIILVYLYQSAQI